jgi:hypothetical protein
LPRLRRPAAVLVALLASGGLAACGNHTDESARVVRADNEGIYLSLGELKYQVQTSRQLNPNDVQDRYLLRGLPAAQQQLTPDEVWFGVFMQVENEGSTPLPPSGAIEIVDTQEEVFTPLALDDTNLFAYRSTEPIPPGEILPLKDTPAYDTPIRGAMLLFKLKSTALDNRPLELKIEGTTTPQTGIIDLDV